MHKIDTNTATANGEFTDGDSVGVVPATDLNASWFNTVQRELANIVTGVGQPLDKANDKQVFDAITRLGIKPVYCDGDFSVSASDKGAIVLFCEAKNFSIEGSLRSGSLIVIVPLWKSNIVVDEITVEYGEWSYGIRNGFGLIAIADNGESVNDGLVGMQFPVALNGNAISANLIKSTKVSAGSIDAGVVNANAYCDSLVEFNYSTSAEGLQDWQKIQLASEWQVGQVKKILCTNAESSGTEVTFYKNSQGNFVTVKFYPNCYREFIYTGVKFVSGGYSFAVLSLNGNPA